MKKLSVITAVLILILSAAVPASADGVYTLDPVTGEVIANNNNPVYSGFTRISSTCLYDKGSAMFVFTTGATANSDVHCSVADGMITTEPVKLSVDEGARVAVYYKGEALDPSQYGRLSGVGSYIVRNLSTDRQLFSFRIVNSVTGELTSYEIPAGFHLTRVTRDGKKKAVTGNSADLTDEGEYKIQYSCSATDIGYELNITVDHTPPQLVINGVEDGIARQTVTFGEIEPGAKLSVTKDGEIIGAPEEIKTRGSYVVTLTDAAGNVTTSNFFMTTFLDATAIGFVVTAGVIIALIIGYMIYSRRHMRVR